MCVASAGVPVVCVDNDLIALAFIGSLPRGAQEGRLTTRAVDLEKQEWPFGIDTLGGIICVHYVSVVKLVQQFKSSLRAGGYLCIETIDGHGGNYLELPPAGFFSAALTETFQFLYFDERRVGPKDSDAVALRLVAKKKPQSDRSAVGAKHS
jgi:hypothetical protein